MQPSPQQSTVIEALDSGDNISVHALAGTGKTSLIEMCQSKRKGLNIAFNAVIRKEFQRRMPNADSHTFNSFGHSICSKAMRITFNENKMKDIRDQLKIRWSDCPDFFRIMDLARGHGFGFGPNALVDARHLPNWREIIKEYDLEYNLQSEDPFVDALMLDYKQAASGLIDYGDQLWFPIVAGLTFPSYPIVYIDEAQDVNPIQIQMIARLASRRAQIVLVGDPHQAIYGFRGSVSDSMAVLEQRMNAKPFPLSVSFRCPKAVVAEARQWVPEFEAHQDNDIGEVLTAADWAMDTIEPGSVILCRNNAPIVSLALAMIAQGRPASVRGKDIGRSLVALAKKVMKKYNPQNRDEYIEAVLNWRNAESSEDEARSAAVNDKAEALCSLLRGCPESATADDIQRKAEVLFTDKAAMLLLSTIHKAKGLEWNNVYILDKWLMPSKFARKPEQIQQEHNLLYVGVTRAKQRLTYINSSQMV